MSAEDHLDIAWISRLAHAEKQATTHYRPSLNVHKWYARRSGAMLRSLLIAEFVGEVQTNFSKSHNLSDTIVLDPFMGGGSTVAESIRLGASVVGADVNPLSWWTVREAIEAVDREALTKAAADVQAAVRRKIGHLYQTECRGCGQAVPVTYFFWFKRAKCSECGAAPVLVHQPLLAAARRHPKAALVCPSCHEVVEVDQATPNYIPTSCPRCEVLIEGEGPGLTSPCPSCRTVGSLRPLPRRGRPAHMLMAIEYRCPGCDPKRRQYAAPSGIDHKRARLAARMLKGSPHLRVPDAQVEKGDETKRLHTWGYTNVVDFFSARQRLALGTFASAISQLPEERIRRALLTVLSDMARYNCELCRYDSWALKCRDAFAIHSFVVPLAYCEVNALGSASAGTGGFPQVLKRYLRAKDYGEEPYDMFPVEDGAPTRIYTPGEKVVATIVDTPGEVPGGGRRAWLGVASADQLRLPEQMAHAIITDPPYFDFVQYRDLLDVHRAWLESIVGGKMGGQLLDHELTVKPGVIGRTPESFTKGLSKAFQNAAHALQPNGLFAFTYHHSRLEAYIPLVVALLDSRLTCTLVLPYIAEMVGSLHIRNRKASAVDSLFLCRSSPAERRAWRHTIDQELEILHQNGYVPTPADRASVIYGRAVADTVEALKDVWSQALPLPRRIEGVHAVLSLMVKGYNAKRPDDEQAPPED